MVGAGAENLGAAASAAIARSRATAAAQKAKQIVQACEAAPALGWAARLAGTDRAIIEAAASSTTRNAGFFKHLAAVADATARKIPAGQVNLLGRINGAPVFGSLVSGTGIAEINGVTMVVKQTAQGVFEVLGPFIP